jgi:hypothetical protein
MLTLLKCLAPFLLLATVARADPPPASHDHWRNTNYPSHYVLYDNRTRTWTETVDCRVLWHFRELSNQLNVLTLYDDSRGMTVRLTYDGMYLKAAGAADFSFYQAGTFDTRTLFDNGDSAISKHDGCVWEEWFHGASGPAFRFTQSGIDNGAVELYDGSRNMGVRLEATRMLLRQGNVPWSFFKNGRWE